MVDLLSQVRQIITTMVHCNQFPPDGADLQLSAVSHTPPKLQDDGPDTRVLRCVVHLPVVVRTKLHCSVTEAMCCQKETSPRLLCNDVLTGSSTHVSQHVNNHRPNAVPLRH